MCHESDVRAHFITPANWNSLRSRVYGITRRGFGQSDFSLEGYGADPLGDDVLT